MTALRQFFTPERTTSLSYLALTAILIGYLSPWLPNPNAGLTFLGLDIGEGLKFLPEMRDGSLPPRDFFYLPPLTLGLVLIVYTWGWENRRLGTWLQRGLGMGVALLALPILEIIRFEPADQWLVRVAGIGLVWLAALASPLFRRLPTRVSGGLLVCLGLLGAFLPLWTLLLTRDVFSAVVGMPLPIGWGFWLTYGGHLVLVGLGYQVFWHPARPAQASNS